VQTEPAEDDMGSSGSGNFSDYPGSQKPGSGGEGGGKDPDDRCARAFSTTLEDVEVSAYYKANGAAPPIGTTLTIVLAKRLVALDGASVIVGNISTKMNYIADCLASGHNYEGQITSVSPTSPIIVTVDFVPA